MNCWEFMQCGREKGGKNVKESGICPAWPAHGRLCAHVVGTLCGGKVKGTCARVEPGCVRCSFYKSDHYDHTGSLALARAVFTGTDCDRK